MDREQGLNYRKELLEGSHKNDSYFDKRIQQARESGPVYEAEQLERPKAKAVRYNLKIARWNEIYWQAKFAKLGYQGDLNAKTGLTAKEMADVSRLTDILKEFSFGSNLVEILDVGIQLPGSILNREDIQLLAIEVLSAAINNSPDLYIYNRSLNSLDRLEDFAKKFGINDEAWQPKVASLVEIAVTLENWDLVNLLCKRFVFLDKNFANKTHKEMFYGPLDFLPEKDVMGTFGLSKEQLENGSEISIQELWESLKGREKLLADSLAKIPEVYFELRAVLAGSNPMQSIFARLHNEPFNRFRIISEFTPDDSKVYRARLCYLLGDPGVKDGTRLEFTITQNKNVPMSVERGFGNHYYFGTNTFELEKASITNKPLYRNHWHNKEVPEENKFEYLISEENLESIDQSKISTAPLAKLAEVALEPERDLSISLDKIDFLAKKYGISEIESEHLKLAVREFVKYTYWKTRSDVGDCLTAPDNFSTFCNLKFRLSLDIARYGENHPEWPSADGYNPCTFLHRVNVIFGKAVMDWTVTQYSNHQTKPIPYIYELGDELKSFGPLFNSGGGKTPNDPYPGTSFCKGYEIIYGM